MALVGFELETLVSEPDALTIRPPKTPLVTNNCYKVVQYMYVVRIQSYVI